MTRSVPSRVRDAAVLLLALLVGVAVGIQIAPRPAIPVALVYCSLVGSELTHVPACPPDTNRTVLATWTPNITVRASWTGREWVFRQPVQGRTSTTQPPQSWREL